MKFLHTADWQIGMKAVGLGGAAEAVREERSYAAKRAVDVAQEKEVDFIILAGDSFEDNAVDRLLVQRVADILSTFSGPVYIIPGNHDPLVPGSVWEHPAWRSASNIQILREEVPMAVSGGTLYPCPALEKHSRKDPTAWITRATAEGTGDGIRIGTAHGTVEGIHQDEPDYPISRDAASRTGLEYLALGHWHSYAAYPDSDGVVRMAYSGTHETTRFGERDSGQVLVVEIASLGSSPRITSVPTGGLFWTTIEKEAHGAGNVKSLREEIESLTDADRTLVRVILSGVLIADERSEVEHIEQLLKSRFLFGSLDTARLQPSPEDDGWIDGLPAGLVRDAAIRIRNDSSILPDLSARALIELYSIVSSSSGDSAWSSDP